MDTEIFGIITDIKQLSILFTSISWKPTRYQRWCSMCCSVMFSSEESEALRWKGYDACDGFLWVMRLTVTTDEISPRRLILSVFRTQKMMAVMTRGAIDAWFAPVFRSNKASLMAADQLPSPPTPNTYYSSDFFTSPKFRFLASKITPFDSIISPTSILEANPSIFSSINPKPTSYLDPTIPKPQRFHPPEPFGLADLVKSRDHSSKPVNKMVLFGSKLRVQIPCADFGTKTGPTSQMRHPHGQLKPCLQTKVLTVSEIDQTEDYTCVISHGPNPTITHIFDNSVFVEEATPPCSVPLPQETKKMDTGFLSNCYTCNKKLDQKQDIYIYRGEKGFCSSECRYQEMLVDQIET
ncbi:unnamed protein product [Brassica rapa]|uniref:FLZ-type domain-containing protein n=1 Tax=Brassica campestris TaxID=3711 RepID=A0A8D9HSN5_BRACM|nr:unnamed protein product [Brassica rapa]